MTVRPGTTTHVSTLLGPPERPALVRWTTWWSSPLSFDSYALQTADGPVLVDPEGMTPEGEAQLIKLLGATPVATVLTNDMHERAAYDIRERWGVPVWAPIYGTGEGGEMEGQPDHLYQDGDALPGGLRAAKLDGGSFVGDTILLWEAPAPHRQRVWFAGDALNGPFNSLNPHGPHPRRGAPGLYVGAGPFYLERFDVERFRTSVRALAEREPPDLICGAHGDPYQQDAAAVLRRLLDLDWAPYLAEKRHPVVT